MDAVGLGGQTVTFRVTVDDGATTSQCTRGFDVDNGCALCGDCNLNGSGPDILDSLTAAQIAVGLVMPSPEQDLCCDVDFNSSINILDSLAMAQAAAGIPVTLMCP